MTDNNAHTATNASFPPSDWVETTLGDVCEITSSKRIFANEYQTSGIPFFRGKEVTEKYNGNEISTELFITEEKYNEIKNNFGVPEENDILLTSVGTLGNPYIVEKDLKFYFKDGNLTWFRKYKNLNPKWLYYWIISPQGKETLSFAKIGSTQEAYTIAKLKNLEILLPPLPQQQAIASVLSAFDDKIELLREQNKTLEEMGQTIFKEWFGKYKVGDDLPEGWRVGKLGEIVDLLNGFAFKSSDFIEDGKYRLVTIANVQDGSFIEQTKDGLNKLSQKMPDYCNLKTGDILLSLTGNVGRICHVIGENYLLNQRVAKLQVKEKQDYGFIYMMFRQKSMIGLLESISAGTAQQNLSPIKTADLEIIIPPREVLDEFAKIINPMIDKMVDNKIQIQSLARTRDTLLPKLMRGEIRVNNFNNN